MFMIFIFDSRFAHLYLSMSVELRRYELRRYNEQSFVCTCVHPFSPPTLKTRFAANRDREFLYLKEVNFLIAVPKIREQVLVTQI